MRAGTKQDETVVFSGNLARVENFLLSRYRGGFLLRRSDKRHSDLKILGNFHITFYDIDIVILFTNLAQRF